MRRLLPEEESQRGCRPPPEGSGSITVSETCHSDTSGGKRILCQRCEVNIVEQGPEKDCGCPAFTDKFTEPKVPLSGQNVGETRCQCCTASRRLLSGRAPRVPHAPGRVMPDLQPAAFAGLPVVALFPSPVRAMVGNGPAASAHGSSTVHCQKGVWSILHQPCLDPTGEAGQGRGVALGAPRADMTGPMQMVQGVAPPDTAPPGSSGTISFLTSSFHVSHAQQGSALVPLSPVLPSGWPETAAKSSSATAPPAVTGEER
ncbi:hypothetical protein AAFF_G00240760 [Aldrovandia affinis]|uniref:Uncharacterized protein n=1 Tax=Aldrovandia affinis TaxID=143900 RepID=A0AAD7SUJ9_9TELE|nr:hypothetical protein AAFF_G00240760 [Aldrovandia affinis]